MEEFLDGTNLLIDRGVTTIDGAQGKKQVWHTRVRTWGLSEANVLYWSKYLWHCLDFLAPPQSFGPPAVFQRPQSDSVPVELRHPLPPSLHPCWLNHTAACQKLQMYTVANNLPLSDKNALNVLD